MKIHKVLIEKINHAADKIVLEGEHAGRTIEATLKSDSRLGSRDRRFIAENIYDRVRWHRKLLFLSGNIQDSYVLTGVLLLLKNYELPQWPEWENLKERVEQKLVELSSAPFAIQESIPDWLNELGKKELKKVWEKEMTALNSEAKVVLRCNTSLLSVNELQKKLATENIETTLDIEIPDGLILNERKNIKSSSAYKAGYFEFMDHSSQQIVPFLNVAPNMTVVDACAGAGGKTLHIACVMKNIGRVIALDVERWKLDELHTRMKRNKITCIEKFTVKRDQPKLPDINFADRLLIDAPCSGLGVLKRNPDAKWKLSEQTIEDIKIIQAKVLDEYSVMLKKGGELVYATCSILPSENEEQIKKFMERHPGEYTLQNEKTIYPSSGYDGFYMANLKKI